ncbi:unnamed protein product [Lepeophtheirus salmonis]|uniref:(salmon louse) hypothetical protein n=1 Tax=Lepeophtheirus salmonis TaxID=72036 RepID=A0A7R8HCC6_LEPSM|nr:unnamed protein product [Lepeophtheirus salmonis]CAF2987228.1 unnamed protein product [Lepeophtheirus salmonis]
MSIMVSDYLKKCEPGEDGLIFLQTSQGAKIKVKIRKTKNTTNQWLNLNLCINMAIELNFSVRKTINSGSLLRSTFKSIESCSWCETKKPLKDEKTTLRTLGNINANYNDFKYVDKEDLKIARDFKNCIHEPLIGQGNYVVIWDLALRQNYIYFCQFREGYQGGQLNTPNCVLLLSMLDTLEQIVPKDLFLLIDTLLSFDKLKQENFGNTLDSNYAELIENYKTAYCKLAITISPKVALYRCACQEI